MNTGKVKFFQKEKGFGFIIDQKGKDQFVHATGLIDEIIQDDEVSFELIDGEKGPTCINVRKIK